GQAVTFTATVSFMPPGAPAAGTPTGTVQFIIDGANLDNAVPLSGGMATSVAISNLTVGSRTVQAVYSGDARFVPSTGTLTQTVSALTATTTTVSSSATPSVLGQPVTFTATVSTPGTGTPSGTVQFQVDGGNFGSPVTLSGGKATSPAISTLTTGGHSVQ